MDLAVDTGNRVAGQVGGGLGESVAKFVASAAAGGFAVSPNGGQALLDVIEDFKRWMASALMYVQIISQLPPLGRLAGGATMSPFMVEVATDPNGFATRYAELWDSLTEVQEAITSAMANYQATEAENEQLLDRIRGSLG